MRFTLKTLTGAVIAGVMAASLTSAAFAADISGAGASFPYPIYAKWSSAYKAATGIGLNYQSIGSGGGIAQIKAKTVTFGATDMPLKPADLQKSGLTQFPTVTGGIVPVINIKGIKPGQLVLNGDVLSKIFLGEISKWNEPEIAQLNPGVKLPNQAIAVVHRSDGSGTTFVFASYLSAVNPTWKSNVGASTSINWPVGIGAKGNEGVASNVAQTSGAIGYVEFAYAKSNKLSHTKMVNKSGATLAPSLASFGAAAAHADWNAAARQGFVANLVDRDGQDVWPIVAATFILMHKKPVDAAASSAALKFFSWAYKNGDTMAQTLDYVPLPDGAVDLIEQSWQQNIASAQ